MSRCFPYPQPGYTLSSARKEALIESIKLQKEKVKAEEQRKKDKKREKKDKRKDKKDKKEKKEKKNLNLDKPGAVQGPTVVQFQTASKADLFQKGSKAESEQQLERSSLTEEHEKPVCIRVPSSSSDSTENSNKRTRQSSPPDISRGLGNIIRIRLPSKKQKQSDASTDERQPCSTSGRTDISSHGKDDISLRLRIEGCSSELANRNVDHGLVPRTEREQRCSTSKQQVGTVAPVKPPISSVMTPMQKEELRYTNLIQNWAPPQVQGAVSIDTEDEDWLFPSKNEGVRAEKRWICRDGNVLCSSSTSSLWPQATFLPEVDVYALPFTVPF